MALPPTPEPYSKRGSTPYSKRGLLPVPSPDQNPNPYPVEILSVAQCWNVLTTTDLGRLAIRSADDINIFPVNFLAKEHLIYFRTAPGAKLIELTANPRVAFEADGVRDALRWSVVVNGTASRLKFDAEIEDSGIQGLYSADRSTKWNYVRITPTRVSGRRFLERTPHGVQQATR